MELKGRVALVTGAAKRIGKALALGLASQGCHVVVHYGRSQEAALAAVKELQALGVDAWPLAADLADAQAVQQLIPQALALASRLDVLVNSASVFVKNRFADTDLAVWNRTLATNLTAPLLLSQDFARQLPPGQQGKIINLLDVETARPQDRDLPYAISKLALEGLTQASALALARRNIQVNGIALGAILPNSTGQSPQEFEALAARIPAGRTGTPEHVVRALLYLLTEADYTTGAVLPVDGGLRLS